MSDNETDAGSTRSSRSTRAPRSPKAKALSKDHHRSRQRDKAESENASLGRALARLRQMFGSAKDPVSKAFEFSVGSSAADKETHRQNLELYEWMIEQSPSLEDQLDVQTRDPWKLVKTVGREIDEGRNEARNSDTAALKKGVSADFDLLDDEDDFGRWNPGLNVKRRSESWGYHHPQLAPLLTPIGMDWENDKDRDKLLSAGGIVDYRCWYPFMYKGRVADSKDLTKGLLRGDLLVKATNYVLHRRPDAQQGGRNVATIIGATQVTIELIAYITTLMRFVLSSEPRIDGGFDSYAFYSHIVSSMREMDLGWVEDLLGWWDNQVFPEQHKSRSTIFPGDTFASIKRQVQRARSHEQQESPGDVDGDEIHSTAQQQDRQEPMQASTSRKRNTTAAGFEREPRVLSEEAAGSDNENDQPRPAKAAKPARIKLRIQEPDEEDDERDGERDGEEDHERERQRLREREREREKEKEKEKRERERKREDPRAPVRRSQRNTRSPSAPRRSPSQDHSSESIRVSQPRAKNSTANKPKAPEKRR
ncbi:hypothetical protein M407DRAFT_33908 [Tulasnella calospora MUT 4182]|uniref:Uncharacterized protein n=1 Tax=Tulasnella calospora MUT 4182 TaxID=1051891 RepID=A0A0C3Q273_9AGAM|nr:hypothetical protein M407DRAFT_33908 [Tulasnella calospora MUT 4182]